MKVKFTALSISSMDMKTVMMLRRKMKPATPSVNKNSAQDQVPAQRDGSVSAWSDFLSGEHDRAHDRDQDQDRGHFKGQQIGGEKFSSNVRGAVPWKVPKTTPSVLGSAA